MVKMDFWASLEHRMHYKKNWSPQLLDMLTEELKSCVETNADLELRMETVKDYIEQMPRNPINTAKYLDKQ